MREDKFNQIIGYLKAFERLNCYCNHGSYFDFEYINYDGDLKSTIISNLKRKHENLKKISINCDKDFNEHFKFDFIKIRNWQESLSVALDFFFLGVFSADYTEKFSYVSKERKYCVNLFIKMIIELFTDYSIDVWASGIESYYSSLTEYYSECSGIDFAFLCDGKIFLLHLGIAD